MKILKKAEEFITGIYTEKINPDYSFHNLKHIQRTVNAANLIAENSKLINSK